MNKEQQQKFAEEKGELIAVQPKIVKSVAHECTALNQWHIQSEIMSKAAESEAQKYS